MATKHTDITTRPDLTPDIYDNAFDGIIGSNEEANTNNFPLLRIYYSQSKDRFMDKEELKAMDEGKMYISSVNGNATTDLMTEITATCINVQVGCEAILPPLTEGDKPRKVFSTRHTLQPDQRKMIQAAFKARDGITIQDKEIRNVCNLVMKLDTPIKLANGESYPIFAASLKGGSFFQYMTETQKLKREAMMDSEEMIRMKKKPGTKLAPSFWQYKFTTIMQTGQADGKKTTYFAFVIKPYLNAFDKAISYVDDIKQVDMFNLVAEVDENILEDVAFDRQFFNKEDTLTNQVEEKVVVSDLPF